MANTIAVMNRDGLDIDRSLLEKLESFADVVERSTYKNELYDEEDTRVMFWGNDEGGHPVRYFGGYIIASGSRIVQVHNGHDHPEEMEEIYQSIF